MHHWPLVELDMHEVYGVDMDDHELLARRSWRWMRLRIAGLLSTESRIQRVLNPQRPDHART